MMMVVLFTTYGFSQTKSSEDYKFFDKSNQQQEPETANAPGEPGDEPPAPIDDYIPLLAAAGVGMAVYFGRRKYMLTK